MIKKILKYFGVGCITSLYFFPIWFSFFPALITKNILAIIGWGIFFINIIKTRTITTSQNIIYLILLSLCVSLSAFASTVINNTSDLAYGTFFISTLIWLGGAFVIISLIKVVHRDVNFRLIVSYLAGVCVFQCIMALLIDGVPTVQAFVDRWVIQGQAFMQKTHRLYGIGASLDTAGGRFAAVLVLLFGLLRNDQSEGWSFRQWLYLLAIAVITLVGNMIARTTSVGVIIGLSYFILTSDLWKVNISRNSQGIALKMILVIAAFIPISVYLYRTSPMFHELFRFGFEGFFSLAEKGEWDVRSNSTLETMVVWPDTLHTWIIGDGYFNSAYGDLNYLGPLEDVGFYMGTDIGYLRFLFYFGIIGLSSMIAFIYYACHICFQLFSKYRVSFVFTFLVALLIWAKVSTDIFLLYALFICAGLLEDNGRGRIEVEE